LYSGCISTKLVNMNNYPTTRELAEEALRVLRENPMTPREHFEFLIQHGIIDRNGRVLVNRLFGGTKREPANGPAAIPTDKDEHDKKSASQP
jgi:D-lyxose ketol-isomerase